MKKEYESAQIKLIMTDEKNDVVTTSGPKGSGAIGGAGTDKGGWT